MQRKALSNLSTFYIKLRIEPRDADSVTQAIDEPTLLSLLNKANLESFGKVGAGAISMLGDGLEIVHIEEGPEGITQRDVILRLASSCVFTFERVMIVLRVAEQRRHALPSDSSTL